MLLVYIYIYIRGSSFLGQSISKNSIFGIFSLTHQVEGVARWDQAHVTPRVKCVCTARFRPLAQGFAGQSTIFASLTPKGVCLHRHTSNVPLVKLVINIHMGLWV